MAKGDREYRLTINDEQAGVLMEALDMYFRVGMGQLREVGGHLVPFKLPSEEYRSRRDAVDEALRQVRALAMPELHRNSDHGIASDAIDDSNRVACDLYDVIRHHVSWERDPTGGWTVNFDKPRRLSTVPLARMETVKKGDSDE